MRVGLVLGGGGVIGLAYHAAALAAMDHDLGWDPRTADVVVGTSAGSVVGAMLRRGIPADDLAAVAVGAEPVVSPPAVARALSQRPEFPPVTLWSLVGRPPRLPSPALIGAWLRRPWRLDPVSVAASVIPDGTLDLTEHASALDEVLGSRWPDDDLWVCTVRQSDLRRVVLGRDRRGPLSQAVAASCAIPGYFRPVQIGRETGMEMLHVAYKGSAAYMNDLIGGQVPAAIDTVADLSEMHKAGRVRILATSGPQRSTVVPDVPTLTELGFKNLETGGWFGFFASVNTPPAMVQALNRHLNQALRSPDVVAKLRGVGMEPATSTPDEFGRRLAADYARWGAVVKATGFTID